MSALPLPSRHSKVKHASLVRVFCKTGRAFSGNAASSILQALDPGCLISFRQHNQIPKNNKGWTEESGDEPGNRLSVYSVFYDSSRS